MSFVTVSEIGTSAAQVSVIVIGYNDAALIGHAVHSALAQGPAVAEVVAVDDASTDRTAAVLDRLATEEPRLRVIHRPVNSGGCGTPRNDGVRAATSPYVMFLDSDDVLPQGAVASLLHAALRHDAPVTAGLCLRRELPRGRDTPWQPRLYREAAVHHAPEDHPALLHDTLCVNKLYARSFLSARGITFPEGDFRYEDFVFTARVLAAAPRVATVPDPVYIWHVRRDAARPSLSLDRTPVANWQARVRAHQQGVEVFLDAGSKPLAHAARVKFLDHDLRMYVRELPAHSAGYRRAWWRVTRACLASFDEEDLRAARAPARWIARVVLATETPRDLDRLAQLAARPARLLPPYTAVAGQPVWAADLTRVPLDGLAGPAAEPARRLPVTVDAELRPQSGPRVELHLVVHDLYDRLALARPHTVDVEFRLRNGRAALEYAVPLTEDDRAWTARLTVNLTTLATRGRRPDGTAAPRPVTAAGASTPPARSRGRHAAPPAHGPGTGAPPRRERTAGLARLRPRASRGPQAWDIRVRVRCAHGGTVHTAARAGEGLRRRALPSLRYGVLLAQPYAAANGTLALRLAPGLLGALGVALRRLRRSRGPRASSSP
ncbi:transferase [Streptomyces cinnamoneus]|uniref:Transferase n=1 Tax=Streptomyces cinnamoneus TaxID=53446 RepID=A0A2G1XF92_STRCJ|nr:transferase [Streptomyces cinnamoneus]PPT13425.1 transferase [Streptomyces cinnamoneus]